VGARKAEGLLACGAAVTVVAAEPGEAVLRLQGLAALHARPYRRGEAAGYRLVVTATGVPEVDAAVAADAEAAGVWVNSADDPAHCTFLLPAVHRDGAVTLAVSTGGASPAMAAWLRDRLARAAGPGLGELAALIESARRRRRSDGAALPADGWRALLDGPLPGLVAQGRTEEAARLLDGAEAPPPPG
jgi:siroheme synthase-like protein